MRILYLVALLMTGISPPTWAQGAQSLTEVTGIPVELYRAANLVSNPAWISGTVLRNVVVIAFKESATAEQRSRVYRLVGAHAVYLDPDDGPAPLFYMAVINSDPDACSVQQAIMVLEDQSEVKSAYPEMVSTFEDDAGLGDVLHTSLGNGRQCPSGTTLLQNRE